ncbi:hypothetical protein [Coprothermobacter platensis]|uniref:hypothetical protein n=1 Tax=Coprothermobacter platensis TaxID=108819 RepID=UPI0003600A84|nr:hypothetical protein [Coprothermobacter platensis]
MNVKSDDINVLKAALALSLVDIPGVADLSPKDALKRVQISVNPSGKLIVYMNIDISSDVDMAVLKAKIEDFVDRLLSSYFEEQVDHEILLEIENVKK